MERFNPSLVSITRLRTKLYDLVRSASYGAKFLCCNRFLCFFFFQTSMRSQHKLTALMVLCCALGPAFAASITKREAPLPGGSYLPPSSGGGAGGYPAAGPPSGSYGPPSSGGGAGGYPSGAGGAPSQQYGAPSQGGSFGGQSPSQQYGAPSAPSQQYGAPSSGSGFGGRPQAPSQQYGAPSHGSGNGHGSNGHGASRYGIIIVVLLCFSNLDILY